jgi:hypothetical protein
MFKAIFVDVDNTLVFTCPWDEFCFSFTKQKYHKLITLSCEELQAVACGPRDKVIESHGRYISRLRPLAKEFLESLQQFGVPVYCLSFGATDFVKQVMQAHDLTSCFDGVYGRDDLPDGVPKVGVEGLLIDDCGLEKPWTMAKMQGIGALDRMPPSREQRQKVDSEQILRVFPYHGEENDDTLMSVTLEKVKERMVK